MDFSVAINLEKRKTSDLLVLPFWKGKKQAEVAADFGKFNHLLKGPLHSGDFLGSEGEILILYNGEKGEDKRIALIGLGEKEKATTEKFRRAYSALAKLCIKKKIKKINIVVPLSNSLSKELAVRGLTEGLLLSNYGFTKHKSQSENEETPEYLEHVTLIGVENSFLNIAEKSAKICEGVYLARDLINTNADEMTPQQLEKVAVGLSKTLPHVKTTTLTKKQMEKLRMGLILAVNRAANHDPAFIIVEYKGAPKNKDLTVILGKGVTYDTGGLNLKPTGSMETMKCDMSGAAAVLGTIQAIASMGLKVNVTAVIPSVENSISGDSYKPGDVYKSYLGKTVEIGNTDAEGRLILADALAYSVEHLKPTRMIDLATLTGAIDIALGKEAAGLMSNNDALADSLMRAGSETFERVWRLPLYEEYRDQLKSDIADINNVGGRSAGSLTAAMFLQEFVGKTPWAHLDIASTAFLSEGKRYHPKYGTGMGVRLLVEFLERL